MFTALFEELGTVFSQTQEMNTYSELSNNFLAKPERVLGSSSHILSPLLSSSFIGCSEVLTLSDTFPFS